jgi:hypothetical protein
MGFKFSRSSVAKIIGDLSRSVSLLNEYPWKLAFFLDFLPSGKYQGSSSSNFSKFSASIGFLISGTFGVTFSLILFQSIPKKKGWALISYTPLIPSLSLWSAINLLIKSMQLYDKFASWGI